MKLYDKPKNMKDFSLYIQHRDWPIMHTHTYWEFDLFIKGPLIHHINGEKQILNENTLCIVRPDDIHSLNNLPGQTSMHVGLRVSRDYFENFLRTASPFLYEKILTSKEPLYVELKTSTVNRIVDSANKVLLSTEQFREMQATLVFFDMFRPIYSHFCKQESIPKYYSQNVTNLIALINNPNNLKKDIQSLIAELNYSYSHMNRLFRQETGISPSKYLKQQRFNYAKQLLTETDMSLENIARAIGYSHYAHFHVAFQKELHTTPSEYRKNLDNYMITPNL